MANPALGTKRICSGCDANFYDLGKTPIVCPTCEAVFVVPKAAPSRARSANDPRSQPARNMGTLKEEAAEKPVADDDEVKDVEAAEDGDDKAEGGVPMLEEMDEER